MTVSEKLFQEVRYKNICSNRRYDKADGSRAVLIEAALLFDPTEWFALETLALPVHFVLQFLHPLLVVFLGIHSTTGPTQTPGG